MVRQQSLADQVFEILKERINRGVFQSGIQIPTENQLAKELKVSRSTIRAAISKSEDRKLVQRRQGPGTYLRELAKIPNPLNEFIELAQLIKVTGYEPGYSTSSDTHTTRREYTGGFASPGWESDPKAAQDLHCQ